MAFPHIFKQPNMWDFDECPADAVLLVKNTAAHFTHPLGPLYPNLLFLNLFSMGRETTGGVCVGRASHGWI